jgi:hypothetical protein
VDEVAVPLRGAHRRQDLYGAGIGGDAIELGRRLIGVAGGDDNRRPQPRLALEQRLELAVLDRARRGRSEMRIGNRFRRVGTDQDRALHAVAVEDIGPQLLDGGPVARTVPARNRRVGRVARTLGPTEAGAADPLAPVRIEARRGRLDHRQGDRYVAVGHRCRAGSDASARVANIIPARRCSLAPAGRARAETLGP